MRKTRSAACIVALVSLLLCSACSGEDASSPLQGAGWEATLEAAKQKDISKFAREVFEDNVITEEEMQQAISNFVSCIDSSGRLKATRLADGGFDYTGPAIDTDEYRTIIDDCDKKTTSWMVIMYFNAMRRNPDNIDPNELIAHCLVKQKVVEPGYSGADYQNDLERYFNEGIKTEQGMIGAPSFTDKERGPDVHNQCTEMSAQEILDLP